MKKFYSILAAALISVCAFASKDVVPSDAVLADYYDQGNVCVCFFVPADMACNDIVLTGSFNSWKSTVADCIPCEAVEGYDGWYVASFEPEAEPDAEKGIQAKPVMLGGNGEFNWEYQVGTATVIRGGVQVVAGYSGEIDLINYGADAPNVFTVDAWKQNPCTAIYHNYTFTVISDGCDGYVVPFLVGGMNGWTFTQMQLNVDLTVEYQVPTYSLSVKCAENTPYQFVSGLMDETGEIAVQPDWKDEAYVQVLLDGEWVRIPGEDGDNLLTHEDANIIMDLRDEDKRWARCAPAEDDEYIVFHLLLPEENSPEEVEIIGTFDDWQGTPMEWITPEGGIPHWFADFQAKPSQYFKIRSAGSWDQELELYNAENDEWSKIGDGQFKFKDLGEQTTYKGDPCREIVLDWRTTARWTTPETGIEDIVLTVKAQKVVVDGVLYIVRDNKLYNVQGAQVR
ncbi:MAG: hypothetical protein J6P74_05505 [Paludibacteraceae bacterium]|nr:hypothetical protein [Paludibacteraceae bacterium]